MTETLISIKSEMFKLTTETMGFVGGGIAGVQIPLARGDRAVFGQNITLDLRTGISYANSSSDAFNDGDRPH